MQYIMILCTCYMTAMLLFGRRSRRRIRAPIAVSRAPAPSYAHNTHVVTGTPSSATCGAAAANQHIHDFGGSRDLCSEWYPVVFRFDPPPEARAWQHLLGDDGLAHTYPAWCVFLLTCSTKAAFVGGRYSKVRDD